MKEIYRIIDANFNRTREGLRVIEEALRFIYMNEEYLKKIRDIRHLFAKKTLEFFKEIFLKVSRDIEKDKGKNFNEIERIDINKLVVNNFLRVEESLRVLEEYSKVLNQQASIFFHDVRFEIYDIEKKIICKLARKKIKVPCVYVILNLKEEGNFFEFAKNVIRARPEIVQLRYKGNNINFFLKIAKELKKIIPDEIIYLINDRIDIALVCESDGVHIGKNDFDINDARKLLQEKIIGVSIENSEDIKNLEEKDVDYIAIGSIFKSPTKPEKKVIGVKILKEIKKYISIPLIGIGGINIKNAKEVIKNGADGIAVISVVEKSENPFETIIKLKEEVEKGWKKKITN